MICDEKEEGVLACAGSMPGMKIHSQAGYKMACSSLCSLVSLSSQISLPVLRSSVKVIRFRIRFVSSHSLLFFDIFYLSTLFVPIKVLCRTVTKDWIRCAPLPIVV